MASSARTFGAPCNTCALPTPRYARIRRCKPDGSGMELVATGVRNSVGVTCFTGNTFPAGYKGVLFNARKGSWNRSKKIGCDIVLVKAGADGKNNQVVPLMTGFKSEAAPRQAQPPRGAADLAKRGSVGASLPAVAQGHQQLDHLGAFFLDAGDALRHRG